MLNCSVENKYIRWFMEMGDIQVLVFSIVHERPIYSVLKKFKIAFKKYSPVIKNITAKDSRRKRRDLMPLADTFLPGEYQAFYFTF